MARLVLSFLVCTALAPLPMAQDPWADPASRAPGGTPPGYAPAQKERRLELTAFAGYQVSSDMTTPAAPSTPAPAGPPSP